MSAPSARRVLVTGATGFVGGAVTRCLLSGGHQVVALVRTTEKGQALVGLGAEIAVGDMSDPDSYGSLIDGVDAVVHTAQYTTTGRVTRAKMAKIQGADHSMTSTLAQRCGTGSKRLVYTSGVFNYGDHGDSWIDEDTPFNPTPLGVGHAAEVTELRLRAAEGLDVVVVSPGFVYGPGGLFKTAFWDQAVKGRLRCIGQGHNYWSCVHVEDLAAAYVAAVENAPSGNEYNVVDDTPLPLRDLVDQIIEGMGRKPVGTIPPTLMGLIIGAPLVESLVSSFRVANTKVRALGWSPTYSALADGLPSTLTTLQSPSR